jgi:hypothetical protein
VGVGDRAAGAKTGADEFDCEIISIELRGRFSETRASGKRNNRENMGPMAAP